MRNKQLSDIFNQMADIMEIIGEDHFRINTYRKVARVIADTAKDVLVVEVCVREPRGDLPRTR